MILVHYNLHLISIFLVFICIGYDNTVLLKATEMWEHAVITTTKSDKGKNHNLSGSDRL